MTAAITARRLARTPDPAPLYALPDVEALIWETVKHLGDDPGAEVRSWAFASIPAPNAGPGGWSTQVSIQVDVRDGSKAKAFRRADDARRLLLALPWRPWAGGTVATVQITDGPSWLPDLDTGRPRYVTQAVVQVHPARTGGPA